MFKGSEVGSHRELWCPDIERGGGNTKGVGRGQATRHWSRNQ